jgi:hypothetical protein
MDAHACCHVPRAAAHFVHTRTERPRTAACVAPPYDPSATRLTDDVCLRWVFPVPSSTVAGVHAASRSPADAPGPLDQS